jgi:hypothetical protein
VTENALNPLLAAGIEQANALIKQNNEIANKVRNAGNAKALVSEFRESGETTDETVLEYRAKREKALEALMQWENKIDAYLVESGLVSVEPVDVEALTAEWRKQADVIKSIRGFVNAIAGKDGLDNLIEVVGLPGTRATGSGGATGVRRPRFTSIAYADALDAENWTTVEKTEGEGADAKVKTNLSMLALELSKGGHKVGSADLQSALWAEAKTEDLSTLEGQAVTFSFGVGDKNYLVRVVPGSN